MYIYFIRNRITGAVYIGQTTLTVDERWTQHCSLARNESGTCFAAAIRKYGPDAFEIVTLGECPTGDLNHLCFLETFCIALARHLWHEVYNIAEGDGRRQPARRLKHRYAYYHDQVHGGPTPERLKKKSLGNFSKRYVRNNSRQADFVLELTCSGAPSAPSATFSIFRINNLACYQRTVWFDPDQVHQFFRLLADTLSSLAPHGGRTL